MFVRNKLGVLLFLGLLLTTTGCDKITSFFSPRSTSNTSSVTNQPNSTTSATPLPSPGDSPINNSNAPLSANTLVKIGDWSLTKDEFKERLNSLKEIAKEFDINDPKSRKLVLDELINQQLLVKEAEEKGVGKKKEISETVNEFRRTLLVRENIGKLVADLQVSDQEAQDYYNQNKDVFVEPADLHLREIMVPTQAEAKEILIELLKGTDFTEMAKARSKSKSAASGGDLGFVKNLNPAMERVINSIDVGGVSSVFQGSDGWYILKLEERKGGKALNFADVKKDIIEGLLDLKRRDWLLKHLDELRQKENIQVNESLLSE